MGNSPFRRGLERSLVYGLQLPRFDFDSGILVDPSQNKIITTKDRGWTLDEVLWQTSEILGLKPISMDPLAPLRSKPLVTGYTTTDRSRTWSVGSLQLVWIRWVARSSTPRCTSPPETRTTSLSSGREKHTRMGREVRQFPISLSIHPRGNSSPRKHPTTSEFSLKGRDKTSNPGVRTDFRVPGVTVSISVERPGTSS